MLELYHNDMSVCAAKVRMVLAEKKLEWKGLHMNLRAGDTQKPEYLKLNPNAVVFMFAAIGPTLGLAKSGKLKPLNAELREVIASPEVSQKLRGIGADPVSGSPEEFATLIRAEVERWGKLVREAGIKPG